MLNLFVYRIFGYRTTGGRESLEIDDGVFSPEFDVLAG